MSKILMLQKMPCIRNWKYANVLNDLGHEVYLGMLYNTLEQYYTLPLDCYKEVFYATSVAGISFTLPYFDIVHCHNESDMLTMMAIAYAKGTGVKVIHDCHDWVAGRQQISQEYLVNSIGANILSDLVIYVSEVQRDYIRSKVGESQSENIVIYNAPLEKYIPKELKKKKEGDKLKIVYAGGVSEDPNSHRFFIPEFRELLRAGHEVYVYAPAISDEYKKLEGFSNYKNMGHCNYENLITELSQYDIGILPFSKNQINQVHLDMGLPNKLFEYISAGLPVACKKGFEQQEKFINENQVGFLYDGMEEFNKKVKNKDNYKLDRYKWTFDKEVKEKLLPYYDKLSAKNKYKKVEPKGKLELKEVKVSLEIYEDAKKRQIGFFGRGHDKDLIFESYMLEQGEKENGDRRKENKNGK